MISDFQNTGIELLKSIPGVGEVDSKSICAAISTIIRLKRAKQLTCHYGLVLSVHNSEEHPIMVILPVKDDANLYT